ncbi:MAG: hypothetical protein BJ554DRAFT_3972 [Olpidium bornovanus]|uniref:Uncharacterized protein n=1 Tax=Olpidium bornovanus TaxID=278681 RepID=A0A8H8DF99_9FUNG|nr:MAG: hypothetical protein BJ554DRAFT_3972 [Olpidium bornovanus]
MCRKFPGRGRGKRDAAPTREKRVFPPWRQQLPEPQRAHAGKASPLRHVGGVRQPPGPQTG